MNTGKDNRKEQKKERVKLIEYGRCEDWFNSISHMIGAALSIVALVLCVVKSAIKGDGWAIAGSIVYGITLILLYTSSSVYHGLNSNMAKRVMRVIDHCMVFILIAGTFTPFLFVTLRETYPVMAKVGFCVVWGVTALGMTGTSINQEKFKIPQMILYIALGWLAVVGVKPMMEVYGSGNWCVRWLLIGGILYTVGAIIYGIGSRKKYFHFVFHWFVLAGSIAHFFAIYFYVL